MSRPDTAAGKDFPGAPEVTVVIPTRNRWAWLNDALSSVFGQRAVDLEVVVVDEASGDETPERLAAMEDPRLRVVRNEQPLGVAGARNRGIEVARGAWVAFLDDDDLWSPDKLRMQLDAAARANATFVYAAVVQLDTHRRVYRTYPAPPPSELAARLSRINMLPATGSNIMVATSRMRELGGFDERLHQIADWDMGLRLAKSCTAAAVPEVLVAYVHHAESMRTVDEEGLHREFAYFASKHAPAGAQQLSYNRAGIARWLAWGYVRVGMRRRGARIYLSSAVRDRSVGNAICAVAAVIAGRRGDRVIAALTPEASPDPSAPNPDWLLPYQTGPAP